MISLLLLNSFPTDILEIPSDYKGSFLLKSPLKFNQDDLEKSVVKIVSSDTCSLELRPFEIKILEVYPEMIKKRHLNCLYPY